MRSLSLNAMSDLARSVRDSFRQGGRVSGNVDLGPSLILEVRPDLAYLPVRRGNACRLNAQSAATLDVLSRKLHALLDVAAPQDMKGRRPTATALGEILRSQTRGQRLEWLRPQAIPVLLQILMHEDASVRRILVELLADIPGDASSVALAQRRSSTCRRKCANSHSARSRVGRRENTGKCWLAACAIPGRP